MTTRIRKSAPARIAPPEIHPRDRVRRLALRERKPPRRRGRAGLILGLASLLVLCVLGLVLLKLDPEQYVRLESMRVEGILAVSEEEMLDLAELEAGQSLLRIDRLAVAKRLESDARVESAEVVLDWPRRVVLRIRERTPLALVLGHGFVDATGHLWATDRRAGSLDLPLVTGLDSVPPEARGGHLAEAAHLLVEAAQTLPGRPVSQLDLTEEGPVLYFESGPGPVRMGYRRYGEKLSRLGRLLAAHPGVQAQPMDLRWHGRVIVSGVAGERGQQPS